MRETPSLRELTPLALLLGVIIGAVFGVAQAYVGLKVGMTISASIPAAVISMGVLRGLLKRGTLLENNMVQTIGSAGESLAAGMIFTIPALYIFGFEPKFLEMVIWGALGGLLGVLFMIPLRRVLIVKEHGKLRFPEGVACAEVLESGQKGSAGARTVFTGLGVGAAYELVRGLGFWPAKARLALPQLRTEAGLDASPALLGVGYILGPRVAAYMLSGAVLGWFVIIPAIAFFGANAPLPILPETQKLIAQMSPEDMWDRYLRYIGAGAVVLGGLLSLFKATPTIVSSMWGMLAGTFRRNGPAGQRTNRDLPLPLLFLLLVGVGYAMVRFPQVHVGRWGAVVVLVFAFFFVAVSSRLVGLVGSSSSPASGMTIATLLGTALIFTYVLDWTDDAARYAAIAVGALVCIAICVAGDVSQDLKTGFLVKATPWRQQVGEIVGVLTATAAIAGAIYLLAGTYGFVETDEHQNPLLAPQANIMKLLVEGVMDGSLPWVLVVAGMAAALVIELLGIPSLPFAVGLYLPLYLSAPIMVGGLVRWGIDQLRKPAEQDRNNGILGASGLVAGEGLIGIALAGVAALVAWGWDHPKYETPLTAKAEMVVPHHFQPWLADKLGMDLTYGLGDRLAQDLPDESLDPAGEPADPPMMDVAPVKDPPADSQDPGDTDSAGIGDAPAQPQDADSDEPAREPAEADASPKPQWDLTWFQLLPLAPFAALVVWLFSTALRRTPVPIGALPPVSPAVEPAPAAAPPPATPPTHDAGPIPLVEPPEPDAPAAAPSADPEPEPQSSIIEFDDQEPPTKAEEAEPTEPRAASDDDDDVAPDKTNDDDDDATGPPSTNPNDRWPPPSPFGT